MKHFFTGISLFPSLSEATYNNIENVNFLNNNRRFTNPILISILNLAQHDEEIRVSVILVEGKEACKKNYEKFTTELDLLSQEIGFRYGKINEIYVAADESAEKQHNTFFRIIDSIQEKETVIADVTYGNKPTPIIMQNALTFAYLYKKNIYIKALTYGEITDHINNTGKIFDVSSLFYVNSLMARMTSVRPDDPMKYVKTILGEGGEEI